MSLLVEYGLSRRIIAIALALLAVIYIVRLTPHDVVASVRRSRPAASRPAVRLSPVPPFSC